MFILKKKQFVESLYLFVGDQSEPLLLDIKGLVCDFSSAVIDQSQLEAAERRRTHFIFDPCDLHKLLVLENKSFSLIRCNSDLSLRGLSA